MKQEDGAGVRYKRMMEDLRKQGIVYKTERTLKSHLNDSLNWFMVVTKQGKNDSPSGTVTAVRGFTQLAQTIITEMRKWEEDNKTKRDTDANESLLKADRKKRGEEVESVFPVRP